MALDAFALVLTMLALGKLCATRVFPEGAADALNRFVLYICLPASVLRFAPHLAVGRDVIGVIVVPYAIVAVTALVVYGLARVLALSSEVRAVLLLCVPLGNTSFLGYPLTRALLGDDALPLAVLYDQLGSFVLLSTWGAWVLARNAGGERPRLSSLLRKVVTFPPVLALVVALVVMPREPPPLLAAGLRQLSDALLPIAAFAVGLTLELRLPRASIAPLATGLALKLGLLPLVALGIGRALGLAALPAEVAVLESAMPPMITAAVLAMSAGLEPRLAAALVGYGTVLSMATLPAWVQLMR